MTLHAYQTLYESSIAFGIRKALQAEQGKTDMENYIAKLEEEKAALEKEVPGLFGVPLYHCTTVPLYHCITVPLYHCTTVPVTSF